MKNATAKKYPKETREITAEEMAVFKQHDEILGRLYDLTEATSDLATIMDDWHPGSIPDRMPPTALVNLLSKQYDAFAKDLSAWLSETRKGGGV
jgi:hypothetical protein